MTTKKKSGNKPQIGQRPRVQVLHALDMQNVSVPTSRPEHTQKIQNTADTVDIAIDDSSFSRLRTWNLALFATYLIQAIVVALLSVTQRLPVSGTFLSKDPLQTAALGEPVLVQAMHHLFDINITALVIAGLAILAIIHLLIATKYRPNYEARMSADRHLAHWISSMLVGGILMLVIAALVGVQDIAVLISIAVLVIVSNVSEILYEKQSSREMMLMVVAKFTGFLPWVLMGLYLIFGGLYGNAVPGYVYWIFGAMYLGFAATASVVWMRYKASKKVYSRWTNPVLVDRVLTSVTFITVSASTWVLFAGVLHP